ncbi:DUF1653 domain-containing protein [Aeromonas bivalvium]|uniref:DUF1653 domain-containing protein n=1 Tax=Aeromonas bivalvium TaxID=440079 RepID=UPI0038CFEC00
MDQQQGGPLPGPGRYRHCKGGFYRVLTLARHTETGESLVVYQSEQDGAIYARPLPMFMESTEYRGQLVSRFTRVA